MKRIIGAAAALALAACATHMPRQGDIKPTPTDKLFAYQDQTAGQSTIVVTRDAGFMGSGCDLAVFIDGKESARLAPSQRATFYIPAGHHVLGTWQTGQALCGYREGTDRRETDASVSAGETRKYRIVIDEGGLRLEPTTLD